MPDLNHPKLITYSDVTISNLDFDDLKSLWLWIQFRSAADAVSELRPLFSQGEFIYILYTDIYCICMYLPDVYCEYVSMVLQILREFVRSSSFDAVLIN